MDERDLTAARPADGPSVEEDRATDPVWSPRAVVPEEDRWRADLDDEVRPLVERCRRLRDRGLLD